MIITIDGPTASGKTSLADELSRKIKFKILHSGLIYRAMAKKISENHIDPSDEKQVVKYADDINLDDTKDPSLFEDEVGNLASKISKYAGVRQHANKLQHDFANANPKVIVEGRDAGTVVFPGANLKIYITASPEVRAERRFKELQKNGKEVIYDNILSDMLVRDARDMERKNSPLIKADDAEFVDTSLLGKQESLELLLSIVKPKLI